MLLLLVELCVLYFTSLEIIHILWINIWRLIDGSVIWIYENNVWRRSINKEKLSTIIIMSKSPKGINLSYKEEERMEERISYSVMMAIREDAVFHRLTAPSEGI